MTATYPTSRQGLEAMGLTFQRRTKCGGAICGATIEWWTASSGRWIPFRLHPKGLLIEHTEECPDKKQFRQKPAEEKEPKLAKQQAAVKQRKEKIESGRLF